MILVFGGTGFVGKNLTHVMVGEGRRVRVVSRRPDTEFLAQYAPGAESLTLEKFLADPESGLFGVKAILYLASTSTPGANLDSPWREARDTVEVVMRVMTVVVGRSDAPFVYLSSGGTVYGKCEVPLITEDTPLNPISPYGLGKKMSEAAVDFMIRTRGLKATVLRPANPIGRWQTSLSQGVVGALMRAAQGGTPFPLIGDGSAVRDYFDVRDLVAAIIAVLDNPEISSGQVWNVGSGQGYSVRALHAMVQEVTGRSIATELRPARSSDVDRVVLDISRIKEILSWAPEFDQRRSLQDIWAAL